MAEIYLSLAKINKSIGSIGKDKTNTQQGFKFRGIDDVMNELHQIFADNEVIICPIVEKCDVEERTNKNGTLIFHSRAEIKYQFIAKDGSFVESKVIGEAMDSGDKGINKAMSIALKYVLLQMFLIPTEEDKDPDGKTHEIKQPTIEDAISEMQNCKTKAEIETVWKKYVKYQKDEKFKTITIQKGNECN